MTTPRAQAKHSSTNEIESAKNTTSKFLLEGNMTIPPLVALETLRMDSPNLQFQSPSPVTERFLSKTERSGLAVRDKLHIVDLQTKLQHMREDDKSLLSVRTLSPRTEIEPEHYRRYFSGVREVNALALSGTDAVFGSLTQLRTGVSDLAQRQSYRRSAMLRPRSSARSRSTSPAGNMSAHGRPQTAPLTHTNKPARLSSPSEMKVPTKRTGAGFAMTSPRPSSSRDVHTPITAQSLHLSSPRRRQPFDCQPKKPRQGTLNTQSPTDAILPRGVKGTRIYPSEKPSSPSRKNESSGPLGKSSHARTPSQLGGSYSPTLYSTFYDARPPSTSATNESTSGHMQLQGLGYLRPTSQSPDGPAGSIQVRNIHILSTGTVTAQMTDSNS